MVVCTNRLYAQYRLDPTTPPRAMRDGMPHDLIARAPNRHSYVLIGAIDSARLFGLEPRRDDWRDIFLAITDTMADDGQLSEQTGRLTAAYVGPVRDGERWSISGFRVAFDALYNAERAQVYRVVATKPSTTA